MAITDPQAVRFANEVIRPTCERLRLLKADVDAAVAAWFSGVNTRFPNTSETLTDGRAGDGVSVLTGADVNNVMTQLLTFQTQLNGGGVNDVVSKPCTKFLVSDAGYVR
jgi:hypothetical protein